MPIKHIIIITLLGSLFSCISYKNAISKGTCIFNKERLTIVGNDSVRYGCYHLGNIWNHPIIWLMNKTNREEYDFIASDEKYKRDSLYFKICHCKDTLWAKKQILNEISRRYPFKVIDSVRHHLVYDVVFRDTSVLKPCIDRGGFEHFPLDKRITFISPATYVEIVHTGISKDGFMDNLKYIEIENITPKHLEYTKYDITIPSKYAILGNMPPQQFIQEMRDSMGVDIILKRDYFEPIKLIIFK